LCFKPIVIGDEYIATTHFIGDSSDRPHQFSDAAMHERCYLAWEDRLEFAARNQAVIGPRAGQERYEAAT